MTQYQGDLLSREAASALGARFRAHGQRLVLTNGVFDVLHAGHVSYLSAARALGDYLLVGLNTDDVVRVLKGLDRPLVAQDDRARVLLGLRSVSGVVLFAEPTASALVMEVMPAVYVKGGDYSTHNDGTGVFLPEASAVEACGGEVVLVPLLDGRSTSALVERIRRERAG